MKEKVPVGIGAKRVGNRRVEVRKVQGADIEKVSPLETAHHEAAHVVMAFLMGIGVIEATDQPGPGYGGYTLTSGGGSAYAQALVFAAAEAQGSKGTGKENEAPGSDMFWIRALGFEPSKVVAHARSILSPKHMQDKICAVATRIRDKRLVDGSEAHRVAKETEEASVVAVTTYDESGRFERTQLVRTDHYATEIEFEVPEEEPGIQELSLAA